METTLGARSISTTHPEPNWLAAGAGVDPAFSASKADGFPLADPAMSHETFDPAGYAAVEGRAPSHAYSHRTMVAFSDVLSSRHGVVFLEMDANARSGGRSNFQFSNCNFQIEIGFCLLQNLISRMRPLTVHVKMRSFAPRRVAQLAHCKHPGGLSP